MSTLPSLLEKSRFNMIEQQIRPAGILDEKVLGALLGLSRDAFVCDKYKNIAYTDTEIPIEVEGAQTYETMLVPRLEARFAEALELKPTDTVLEIGTGSGFQAALLSRLCTHVTSIEINPHIAAFAKANLEKNHITNVKVEVGDGQNGWGGSVEYQAILVTSSLPSLSDSLKYKLAIGGRLVVVVGTCRSDMKLIKVTRLSASEFSEEVLQETYIKPLRGTTVSRFKF
ncbi:protein-L-isoaspartate O-methyltransferase family protein [Pelistega europaea]|uniref:Protein-L-isoaspartate O-methyltransferase n=1 Tax=Pelistega europaea TaxID=106147 RepID=A0A7Y4L941_9BURK|nr:protein-L-isoaspartate O-methyltransferase [Pelistega europaea]NOL49163.1 protein-L-isoaspartate O-methyltransferase [Pelistega europaea]